MKSKLILISLLVLSTLMLTSCMRQIETGNEVIEDARELQDLVNKHNNYTDYSKDVTEIVKSKIKVEDTLESVEVLGDDVYIKITLNVPSIYSTEEFAIRNYELISTSLLNSIYEWKMITIEFTDVGKIGMHSASMEYFDADNEYRFIDSEIRANFVNQVD